MTKRRDTKMSRGWALLAVAPFSFFSACGGGSGSTASTPTIITVAVGPASPSVSVGASKQFTAMVSGTSNKAVSWSVAEANGGSIDASGKYTAPMKAGSFHVVATSQADSSKSGSVSVSVTAPAPVFSTTPPTASTQDMLYSYSVAATDPAGTAVTLTLTTAPQGATLTSGTVVWTPNVNQSRAPNTFTVTATSDAGGTATQSWSLSPDGTVFGHFLLHFWGGGNETVLPERDFSLPPISRDPGTLLVWAPQPDGSLQVIQGIGFADGTFQFPNVPAGNYIFSLDGHPDVVQGIQESSSTINWDADQNGFPPLDPSQWWPEALTINVDGFVPFVQATDEFDLFDRDGGWSFTSLFLPDGDTSFTFAIPELLQNAPSITDRFVAVQTRGVTGTDPFTSHIQGPAQIQQFADINNVPAIKTGTIVDFSGELGITTPGSLDLNIAFSSFANAFATAGPGPSVPNSFTVLATSMVKTPKSKLSDPQMNEVTPIFANAFIQGPVNPGDPDPWPKDANGNDTWPSDQDFGTLNYNDPYGAAEKTVYIVDAQANFSIPFPGSADPLPWTIDTSYAVTNLSGPVSSFMLPPANAKADGVDFLSGGTIGSATPTLSWDAPAGRPNGPSDVVTYDIFLCEPQNSGGGKGGGGVACVFDFLVNNVLANSLVVPAGILQPGHSYIFNVIAGSVRDYDSVNQQRFSYPVAFSQVTSAAMTVPGAKAEIAQSAQTNVVARPAVNSPLHRMILPSISHDQNGPVLYTTPAGHDPATHIHQLTVGPTK